MNLQHKMQSVPEQCKNSSHSVVMRDTDPQDGSSQPPPPCAVIPISMVQMDLTNSYVMLSCDFAPISGKVTTTNVTSTCTNQPLRHSNIQPSIQASGSSLTTGQSSLVTTSLQERGTSTPTIPIFSRPSSSQSEKYVLATQLSTNVNDTKMINYLKHRNSNYASVQPSELYSQFVEKFKVDTFKCLVQQLMITGPANRRPGDWCISDILTQLAPYKMDSKHLQHLREKCSYRELDVVKELLCYMYMRVSRKEISGTFLDHYWEAVLVCGQVPTYRPDDMTARQACPIEIRPSQTPNTSGAGTTN